MLRVVALFSHLLIQIYRTQFYRDNLQDQCHGCPVIPCWQYLDLRLTNAAVSSEQATVLEDY